MIYYYLIILYDCIIVIVKFEYNEYGYNKFIVVVIMNNCLCFDKVFIYKFIEDCSI